MMNQCTNVLTQIVPARMITPAHTSCIYINADFGAGEAHT